MVTLLLVKLMSQDNLILINSTRYGNKAITRPNISDSSHINEKVIHFLNDRHKPSHKYTPYAATINKSITPHKFTCQSHMHSS